ncbi:GtrA family protein [Rhodococcus triatomae]|uniref:Putative flippase GtrA (Transmembrane translocase of bactoprenol-linked glucose) n=1 Tax=Rhodococcus triatomae TaxID=300028 RepID=A0A1G8NJQ4_9NOCA|nr:GtrA family protein [Rhodococcus triatomae]QNG20022.1 GtrA family protein [Rhodococcus triatomae]QNG24062.1 GtrA family protein [Rhodococcus triatomae]SDI80489.1 Putative flippase GtrA (transmembrane translocase of bactoprenol-linked glucose) [Rhodococcus triatomae]
MNTPTELGDHGGQAVLSPRTTYPWCGGRADRCRLRGDGVIAQFVRFALVGGSSNIAYVALFLLLDSNSVFVANAVGAVASTILANELHRRLTFHAADRVHWLVAQWEAGGLALAGLMLTTVALAVLGATFPSAAGTTQVMLVIAVGAVVGTLRFLALRGWVFSVR